MFPNRTLIIIGLASVCIAGAYSWATEPAKPLLVTVSVAADTPDANGNPYVPDECRRRVSEIIASVEGKGIEHYFMEGATMRAFERAMVKLHGATEALEAHTARVYIFTHPEARSFYYIETDAEGCVTHSSRPPVSVLRDVLEEVERNKL